MSIRKDILDCLDARQAYDEWDYQERIFINAVIYMAGFLGLGLIVMSFYGL